MLRKEDNDWVKKCMEFKVEGSRPRGRPRKTWREIVEKDCRARRLNTEDAMDRSRWRKQIGMIDDHDECSGLMFLLVPAHPGCPGQIPQNRKTVCVCVCVQCMVHYGHTGHMVPAASCRILNLIFSYLLLRVVVAILQFVNKQ